VMAHLHGFFVIIKGGHMGLEITVNI
jgi:hypothetical protein